MNKEKIVQRILITLIFSQIRSRTLELERCTHFYEFWIITVRSYSDEWSNGMPLDVH